MAEGRSSSPPHSPPSPLPMSSPDDNSEGDIVLREREDDDDIGKGEGGEWDGDELLPSAMLIINGYNL